MAVIPHSHYPGVRWPAIADMAGAQAMALQFQLEQSQWFDPETLRELQLEQLGPLIQHAYKHSPFYRQCYLQLGVRPRRCLSWEQFRQLPIIKRAQIQLAGEHMQCQQVPEGHQLMGEITTSGSTGMSVTLAQTAITQTFWRAFTLRDHLWHRRRLNGVLASIRNAPSGRGEPPDGTRFDAWGMSTTAVFPSGRSHLLNIHASVDQQLEWLASLDPDYLLTYPSNLLALQRRAQQRSIRLPSLLQLITMGELVPPNLREQVRQGWGAPIKDIYSCQEAGYLALQCPEHEHYHVQSENLLLEVLDEDDQPCAPGQIGRVVITSLHNYATPLIRYELGDFARVGEACPCGRGLPVLTQVMGRVRNMLRLPDGSERWPYVGSGEYRDIGDIRQFQLIQTALDRIQVHLVSEKLSAHQQDKLRTVLQRALQYRFNFSFHYHDQIQRSGGGKFEDFVSQLEE